ncbi:MAG: hypothetical protein IH609_02750 [Dehalococcoidia bacterium]|nr:hypothetical protein [Dehalococcoidia bacterium]
MAVAALVLGACASDDDAGQPAPSPLADGNEFGVLAPPPGSLDDITSRMSIAVRGRYAEVLEVRGDPRPVPTERAELLGTAVEEGSPYTLMRFAVTEYIVGEGPMELTVGQAGDLRDDRGFGYGIARPVFGQEITLIAVYWEGDSAITVPLFGDYTRFVERNGRLAYAFLDAEKEGHAVLGAMPFADGMSLAEFHEALREAARARGMVVPDR